LTSAAAKSPFTHERRGDRFDLRPQQGDLVAGHQRPVEIAAHRLVRAIEPRSQVDSLPEIGRATLEAPGVRIGGL
jgi:hypothetical protein